MKKTFCILLSLAILLSLCACGRALDDINKPFVKEETIMPVIDDEIFEPPVQKEETIMEALTEEPAEEAAPDIMDIPEKMPDDATDSSLTVGYFENNVYYNETLELSCIVPDGWTYVSAEEISPETKQIIEESGFLNGEELSDQISVMSITDPVTSNSTNIIYTLGTDTIALMTEEEMINELYLDKDVLEETYTSIGLENVDISITTVEFLGQSHPALLTTMSMDSVNMVILQLTSSKASPYATSITIGASTMDELQQMLDLFAPI